MLKNILLIDDNEDYCLQVQKRLTLRGYHLHFETIGKIGLKKVMAGRWQVILLDVFLNQEVDGLEILQKIVADKPQIPVIMVSGASTLHTAVEATKTGAYDFLEKPLDVERLELTLKRALERYQLTTMSNKLLREISGKYNLVGHSESIQNVYHKIKQIAPSDAKVLIEGEIGVGKEVFARVIHYNSQRESFPFVAINCAAIPVTLIESELFGHKKGAFTGAQSDKEGFIAEAEGGTLFLDEVGELPLQAQTKLLKFLNDGQYSMLGSTEVLQSDVRVLAATNRDLKKAAKEGEFRKDLYYRLNVLNLKIPSLKDRPEDIEPLAHFFLQRSAKKNGKSITHFSEKAMDIIKMQQWLGNVRQLKSAVDRMVIFSTSQIIDYGTAAISLQMDRTMELVRSPSSYQEALQEFEKLYFINQLDKHDENLEEVAASAQLSLEALCEKLAALDIKIDC